MIPRFAVHSMALSRAVDAVYGELFSFVAYAVGGSVNAPKAPDATRPTLLAVGTWHAQSQAGEPKARGSVADDSAHAWIASRPQVSVDDAALLWLPRQGDHVVRMLDQQMFEIAAVFPEGARRTVFELTARKRSAVYSPSLDFSEPLNSQFLPVI